jgi:hypothetical protein
MATDKKNGNPASTQPAGTTSAHLPGQVDTSDWEKEDVGFAPFWGPDDVAQDDYTSSGGGFVGAILGFSPDELENPDKPFDARTNKVRPGRFARWMFRAVQPMMVGKGSVKGGTFKEMQIGPGDRFNVSVYSTLDELFRFYLWVYQTTGKDVLVKCVALHKSPTASNNTVWNWEVSNPPDVRALLKEWRPKYDAMLAEYNKAGAPAGNLNAARA